jgi:hypothetical protein
MAMLEKPDLNRLALHGVARYFFVLASALFVVASCTKPPRAALIPDDYASWKKTTETVLNYPIPGHEDRFRVIHINDVGLGFSRASDGSGRVDFPDGTVIAKEIFAVANPGPADKPVMITGMVKASSDTDARSGWLWLMKDLASGKENVYTGDFCVRCHANANEKHPYGSKNPSGAFSDYVFFIPGDDQPLADSPGY